MSLPAPGRVAILMGCFNGVAHLAEQLASIEAQDHRDWVLIASDDGSSDDTVQLLSDFRARVGEDRVWLRAGPRRGFVANFLSLACDPQIDADWFAFCDQDDVWLEDKLSSALRELARAPSDQPLAHGARTLLIDQAGQPIGISHPFSRPPSFRNALVQSIAGANTMLFNRAARKLLIAAGPAVRIASHDWWLYQLVTGAGGQFIFSLEPKLRYRQHPSNLQGQNVGLRHRLHRLRGLLHGQFAAWNTLHCAALSAQRELLTKENRAVFDAFVRLRQLKGWPAIQALRALGCYRQRRSDNLALYLAAALGRL